MDRLHIYGDESCTMPINDGDKPFVAATVSFLEKKSVTANGLNEDEKLVQIFKEQSAMPVVIVVNPFPGYGKALKQKHNKMQVMARAMRFTT